MRSSEVTDGEDVADELINLFVPDEKKDDDARGPKGRVATRRFFKAALVALMTFACAFSMYVVVARDRRREGMWGVQQHLRVKVHRGDPSGGQTLEHLFAGAPNVDLTHPSIKFSTAITQAPHDYAVPPRGAHWVTAIEGDEPGELLATWVSGSPNETADSAVYIARYSQQVGRWSEPQRVEVSRGAAISSAVWYPVLCRLPRPVAAGQSQQLSLFFKKGSGPLDWRGMQVASLDGGVSWGGPTPMLHNQADAVSSGVRITGPYHSCHVSQRPKGAIILAPAGYANTAAAGALVEYSQDDGDTWRWTKAIPFHGEGQLYHASLFTDRAGGVRMMAQQRPTTHGQQQRAVHALLAVSTDGMGLRWGEAREVGLPNPDSPMDVATLTDGRVLAVYNHAHRPGIRSRAQLSVALSYDDGETWRPVLALDGDTQAGGGWEYARPSVTQTRDSMVHVVYIQLHTGKKKGSGSSGKEAIRHVVLDPRELDADYLSDHPIERLPSNGVGNAADGQEVRHSGQPVPGGEEDEEGGWLEHPDAAQHNKEKPEHSAAVLYDDDFNDFDNSGARLDTEGQPISSKIDG